jgi:hypothetical protein
MENQNSGVPEIGLDHNVFPIPGAVRIGCKQMEIDKTAARVRGVLKPAARGA